jgi:hypothetical protein
MVTEYEDVAAHAAEAITKQPTREQTQIELVTGRQDSNLDIL